MSRLFRFHLAAGSLATIVFTLATVPLTAQQPVLQKRIIPLQPRPSTGSAKASRSCCSTLRTQPRFKMDPAVALPPSPQVACLHH